MPRAVHLGDDGVAPEGPGEGENEPPCQADPGTTATVSQESGQRRDRQGGSESGCDVDPVGDAVEERQQRRKQAPSEDEQGISSRVRCAEGVHRADQLARALDVDGRAQGSEVDAKGAREGEHRRRPPAGAEHQGRRISAGRVPWKRWR